MSSCEGHEDGNFQSCNGCDVYITCSYGVATDNRPCPAGLVWNDNIHNCDWTSPTCQGGQTQVQDNGENEETGENGENGEISSGILGYTCIRILYSISILSRSVDII